MTSREQSLLLHEKIYTVARAEPHTQDMRQMAGLPNTMPFGEHTTIQTERTMIGNDTLCYIHTVKRSLRQAGAHNLSSCPSLLLVSPACTNF